MVRYFRKELKYLRDVIDSIENNISEDRYDTKDDCIEHLKTEIAYALKNIIMYHNSIKDNIMGKDIIYLFADGSAYNGQQGLNNGGWGYKIYLPTNNKSVTGYGSKNMTTNNEMEITAVTKGLEKLSLLGKTLDGKTINIVTDSQYVANTFNKNWISGWIKNNWKNSSGKQVANVELWKELMSAIVKVNELNIKELNYLWIKGHIPKTKEDKIIKEYKRFKSYNNLDTDLETFKNFFMTNNDIVDELAKEGLSSKDYC